MPSRTASTRGCLPRVLRQRPALPLDDLLEVGILLVHRPTTHLVRLVVHRLDDMEVVVHDVRILPQEVLHPFRIGGRHVAAKGHDGLLQLPCAAACRLAEEWDLLDPRLAAVGTVEPMGREPDHNRNEGVRALDGQLEFHGRGVAFGILLVDTLYRRLLNCES